MSQIGTQTRGWLVRLVAAGKVLAVRASTSGYEDLGKDEGKLRALLAVPDPAATPLPRAGHHHPR